MTAIWFVLLLITSALAWRRCRKMYIHWQYRRDCINAIEAEVRRHAQARQQAWNEAWEAAAQQADASHAVYEIYGRPRMFRPRLFGSI